jgi:hypothetical protein
MHLGQTGCSAGVYRLTYNPNQTFKPADFWLFPGTSLNTSRERITITSGRVRLGRAIFSVDFNGKITLWNL